MTVHKALIVPVVGDSLGTAPVYHGQDEKGARKRARQIVGYVIFSKAPASSDGWGYWSESGVPFLRGWEKLVYQYRPRKKK